MKKTVKKTTSKTVATSVLKNINTIVNRTKIKREESFDNPFALDDDKGYWDEDKNSDLVFVHSENVVRCTKEIETLIDIFGEALTLIDKKYKIRMGIGDTATDESIVDILYSRIH